MGRAEAVPALHAVTDDGVLARPGFVEVARAVAAAGGAGLALHLRGPATEGGRLHRLACEVRDAVRAHGALLVVNDRLDVAMAAGADGVQLGARGLEIADARRLAGEGMRIGASVHSAGEGRAAVEAGADWVIAGTTWATPSHPGRPGAGLPLIRALAAAGVAPVAIGGVTVARAAEARAAGAAGAAVLRGIWDAPDPADAVRQYLESTTMTDTATDTIRVRVNGDAREIPAGLTAAGLLAHLGLHPRTVVVEHNGAILRREALDAAAVSAGDAIELVHFVGGG